MEVLVLSPAGVQRRPSDDLAKLLTDPHQLIWVDIPAGQEQDTSVLADVFGFHEMAVRDCVERNHVAKLHAYADHVFSVLHAPHIGDRGHVHYVELDQFLGPNYLVTVHGPLNPSVDPKVASLDTNLVLRRMETGHLRPRTPFELSSAIVSSMTRREIDLVARLARECGQLEQRLTLGDVSDDPEEYLEDLFEVWYELLAIRTMAVHSRAAYQRMATVARSLPEQERPLVSELADRFDQVANMADGQREFLHGVIEFFQTRTSTHMTIAAERLTATSLQQNDDMRRITAWVAIVAVPTAVTGFFGQNVPYPGFGQTDGFVASIAMIVIIAAALYVAFKRKEWL